MNRITLPALKLPCASRSWVFDLASNKIFAACMLLAFFLLLGACNNVASIGLKTNESGTLVLGNRWDSNITYSLNGARAVTIASNSTADITVNENDTIVVSEGAAGAFRSWSSSYEYAFVSGVNASIISMPPMDKFTTDIEGTTAGDYFFSRFNSYGALTSLPKGSFNTSKITEAGAFFFAAFNRGGSLTSLPAGSFNL
jgi:hypothetical protein